jgi:hypothetical protein
MIFVAAPLLLAVAKASGNTGSHANRPNSIDNGANGRSAAPLLLAVAYTLKLLDFCAERVAHINHA